jgi:hypothetical protein
LLLALGFLLAAAPACFGAARETGRAFSPRSLLDRIASVPSLLPEGDPKRPDPGPEDPPAFPLGYRPEPWQTWESPDPLRRVSLSLRVGFAFYYADSIALKMDNPTLFETGSEDTGYRSLWEGNAFHATLEAGLAVTPALSLVLQGSYTAFRHEVSPPPIYVTHTGLNDFEKILSADDLTLVQVLAAGRLALPLNQISKEPVNLWKWREPADATGFIPFLTFGAGVALIDRCGVSVQRMAGGNSSTVRRDLFLRTVNLAVEAAIGLEYRFSFLSFDVRVEGAYNGKPASGWAPYTNAAQPLLTYHLLFSARACF